jgi:Putative 2OG-Fe(II) oxygenase
MNKYLIRYNKSKGQPGRGTDEHAWRVFENGKEYLFKHLKINVPIEDEQSGPDFNIACSGVMTIDRETSTAIINKEIEIFDTVYLPNLGILRSILPDNILNTVKNEISFIENNFSDAISYNHRLAGNIKREFELKTCYDQMYSYLEKMAESYLEKFSHFYDPGYKLNVRKPWVNFMQKYEFNPLHIHSPSRCLSYVVWIRIPYDPKEEHSQTAVKDATIQAASDFMLCYSNILGTNTVEHLSPDKSWEGTIIMFPSDLFHQVYPFYTSEGFRVSVAGNIEIIY